MPEVRYVDVSSSVGERGAPEVRLRIGRPGAFNDYPLNLGAAYALAQLLLEHVEGFLACASRPWDDDPGRTPFASRSSGRAGTRSVSDAPAGVRARRRPPRDDYPRPRSVRPGGPVDSAP